MPDASLLFSALDWKRDDHVKGFIETLLKEKETVNADSDRQAEINSAWYQGHQLLRWNKYTGQLSPQSNPYHRVRLVVNLMRGLIDGYAAKLALDKVRLVSEPMTDELTDHESATLQTKVLRYYQQALDGASMSDGIGGLSDELDMFAILTGEGFAKVIWDPMKGSEFDEFSPDEFGMTRTEFDKEFGRELEEAQLRTGDLSVTNIPLYNIYWGPAGVPFEQAEYVLEVYERSVAHCMERYRLKRDEVAVEHDQGIHVWRAGQSNVYGSVVADRTEDNALVKELWVKPNRAIKGLERGRHVILVTDHKVTNDSIPYRHRQIPIVRWTFMTVPGEYRGKTFVDDMLPPQADINKTVSQFCENRETMANPTWLVSMGSVADEEEWNSRPGGVRRYIGQMPELKQGVAMPNAVLMMLAHQLKFLQDIVGLRDVSQGKNPPGVRSGRGLALLKESDDERLAKVVVRRRNFWARVGHLMLQTLAQYVTEERIVRLVGEEAESETLAFTGDELGHQAATLGAERFNVRVESRGMPRSYSARLEALDRALERRALNPAVDASDKALVLDALELGEFHRPLDGRRKARRMQQVRNQRMLRGEQIVPDIHEDLETMLQELARFRHEPFFPDLEPEIKGLFNAYEDQAIGLMALKGVRIEQIGRQALQQAGVLPPANQAQTPQPPAGTEKTEIGA